ncbi:hypothetical protein BC937DRAFT_87282, partial [Endogone sp. FLAS-F59071]
RFISQQTPFPSTNAVADRGPHKRKIKVRHDVHVLNDDDEDEDMDYDGGGAGGEQEGSVSGSGSGSGDDDEGEDEDEDEENAMVEKVKGKQREGENEDEVDVLDWLAQWVSSERGKKDKGRKEDDPEVCCVCLDDTTGEDNVFVYCDTTDCEVCVHQDCYGIKELPGEDDPWYCDRCKAKMEKPSEVVVRICRPLYLLKSCVLCPNTHGAFRRLSENDASKGWIHVVCALWIQEVWLHDQVYIKEIEVKGIPAKKWNMVS